MTNFYNSFDKVIGIILWVVVLLIGAILVWQLPVTYAIALIFTSIGFLVIVSIQILNQRRIDRRAFDFDQEIEMSMPEASAVVADLLPEPKRADMSPTLSALQNRIDEIHAQSVKELKTAVSGDTSTALKQGLADAFASRSDEQRQIDAESDQGSPRVIQIIERIAGPALVLVALFFVFQGLGLLF